MVAALLQPPLAWLWGRFYTPDSYEEDSVLVYAPPDMTTDVGWIHISNNGYRGVRWVEITSWPATGPAPELITLRSNPGGPYTSNPLHPWDVHAISPGAANSLHWPASLGVQSPSATSNAAVTTLEALGWPFLAVQGRWDYDPTTGLARSRWLHHTFANTPWPRPGVLPLPYRPMWPGFAYNTLILGALLFPLFAGSPALRRWLRRKPGACPRCRYDLRGHPRAAPCPECGTPRSAPPAPPPPP